MSNKKLFIHIPKNGGMTIRRSDVLKPLIMPVNSRMFTSLQYEKSLYSTMKKSGDHHGIEHARWRDLKETVTNSNDAFAIIRNPWSRVASRYFFALQVIQEEKKVPQSYCDVSSFESFLDERFKWEDKSFFWHRAVRGWFPAFDHVSDQSGNHVMCDILRLEHLNDEIEIYFHLRKGSMTGARNVTKSKKKVLYQDLYTNKTIQIVADWYKKDIDYWGFTFDSSAKRNTFFTRTEDTTHHE